VVAAKEKDVLDKTQAELAAREMFTNKERELREAQALVEQVRGNADRLLQLQEKKEFVDRQIADARNNEKLMKENAERAVKPAAITDNDVTVFPGSDHRFMYIGGVCGAIFVAFSVMILITLHGAAQEMSLASLPRAAGSSATDQVEPTTPPAESNGQTNGQASHNDGDEHEPATA